MASSPEPLHEPLLREIAAAGGVKHYPARTVLINEGDQGDALFVILSGRVKVYVASESGKEAVLNTQGAGEWFGELAMFGEPRSASVMTLEPTTCAVVPGARLREFVAAHPDFAIHLLSNLFERVRSLTGNVKRLALESVYSRIIQLLSGLARPEGDHLAVDEKLTQQDIAERIGSSREMVSRVLKELAAGGYVETRDGRIVILKKPPAAW